MPHILIAPGTAQLESPMSKALMPLTEVVLPLSFDPLSEDQYLNIINQIAELKALFRQNAVASTQKSPDDFLNLNQAVVYTGLSKSFWYKITASNELVFYKPNGKTIFFKRADIDNFLCRHKIQSNKEISIQAEQSLLSHRLKSGGIK